MDRRADRAALAVEDGNRMAMAMLDQTVARDDHAAVRNVFERLVERRDFYAQRRLGFAVGEMCEGREDQRRELAHDGQLDGVTGHHQTPRYLRSHAIWFMPGAGGSSASRSCMSR